MAPTAIGGMLQSEADMEIDRIVIVGAGAAGLKAAQTLRDEGYRGSLTLVGDDPERPYQRPPLSKGYLMGDEERDSVFFESPDWFAEHDVELRTGTSVAALEPESGEVVLSDGGRLAYDRLLLATGSRARVPQMDGASLPGALTLRTLDDADALQSLLPTAERLVIVGGGWIGLEVAAAARAAGVEVTVLESAELPLLGVLGPRVAQIFADLHRKHGVDLRCGVQVRSILGSADGVSSVELADGTVIGADLVVLAVGAVPNTRLAEAAGLDVDGGIVADETLRTSDPRIWAAGDVAAAWHPVLQQRLRVEHIENALAQGPAAARAMLGSRTPYDTLPLFYTDQYELGMEYIGHVPPGSDVDVVLRGDVDGLEFMAFWLSEGVVLAGMHVNLWDATDEIRDLVTSRRVVDTTRLADAAVPLSQV